MNKIKYKKGYKYKIVEDVITCIPILNLEIKTTLVELNRNGKLTIKKEYSFDGPSGPAIDTKNFMRGSLVHDALYQLIRLGHLDSGYRKTCDKILVDICKKDGMSALRRAYVYRGVRMFGGASVKPREVYIAP